MTNRNTSLWGAGGLRRADPLADPGIFDENFKKHKEKLDLAERIFVGPIESFWEARGIEIRPVKVVHVS